MSSVAAYRDLDQLDQIRLAWNALLGETEDATFFQTLEWFQFSLRTLRPNWRPLVLVVESLGKPIGILPLCVEETRTRWGVQRRLLPPPATASASFRPIGKQVTATLVSTARFLSKHPRWWDVAEWTGIERHRWDRGRTEDAFTNAGVRWVPTDQQVVIREQLFDDDAHQGVIASRSSDKTTNDRRARNWSTVELRPVASRFGDGDPQWDWFDRWVSQVEWDHLATFVASDLQPRTFLEQVHAFSSDRGVGKLVVVSHDDEPVAFQYQLIWDGAIVIAAEGQQSDSSGKRNPVFYELLQREVRESGRRDGDRWIEYPIQRGSSEQSRQEMIVRQSYRGSSRPGWSHMWRWLKSG